MSNVIQFPSSYKPEPDPIRDSPPASAPVKTKLVKDGERLAAEIVRIEASLAQIKQLADIMRGHK